MSFPHPTHESDAAPAGGLSLVVVDARGLLPPEPLVRILGALESLPEGGALEALTDRRPVHLHDLLAHRGFIATTEPTPHGSFLTTIHRA